MSEAETIGLEGHEPGASSPRAKRPSTRLRVLLAFKIAVSLALVAALTHRIASREGVDALTARAANLDAFALLAAVALHFTAAFLGVLRWRVLLRARGLDQSLSWLFRSFLIGRFFGAFTPSTVGLDGWRAYDLARRTGDAAGSAGTIVLEKLFGLVGIAWVCAALTLVGALDALGPTALPIAIATALAACIGIFFLASPARTRRLAQLAPGPIRGRVSKFAEALATGDLGTRRIALAVALGIATHLALSAVFAATGAALFVPVNTVTLLAVGNAITIAVLLPISVGGVGVREGVAVVLLEGAGVSTSDAALVALLGFLSGQVPALLGGLLLLARRERSTQR